jgi:hypothetical protein
MEPTKSARLDQAAEHVGSGAGLVGGALAAGGWACQPVRPDPATLGVVGERGSRHEDCLQSVPGCLCTA